MEFEWDGSGNFGAVSFRGLDMPDVKIVSKIILQKASYKDIHHVHMRKSVFLVLFRR
jgi:hypothetical protein